jgi:hypothetical protein
MYKTVFDAENAHWAQEMQQCEKNCRACNENGFDVADCTQCLCVAGGHTCMIKCETCGHFTDNLMVGAAPPHHATEDEFVEANALLARVTKGRLAPAHVYALPEHAAAFYQQRAQKYSSMIAQHPQLADLALTIAEYT